LASLLWRIRRATATETQLLEIRQRLCGKVNTNSTTGRKGKQLRIVPSIIFPDRRSTTPRHVGERKCAQREEPILGDVILDGYAGAVTALDPEQHHRERGGERRRRGHQEGGADPDSPLRATEAQSRSRSSRSHRIWSSEFRQATAWLTITGLIAGWKKVRAETVGPRPLVPHGPTNRWRAAAHWRCRTQPNSWQCRSW